MNAIRKIVEVKNHQLNITLPDNFNADKVEVIILPSEEEFIISEEEKKLMRERLKSTKEEEFSDWDLIKHNYL